MTVRAAFIEPMLRNFEEPPGIDSAGFFADLEDELCTYDDELLHEAYRHIRQTYKFRKFPTIAQCLAACQQVPRPDAVKVVPETQRERDKAADKVRREYRACGMLRGSDLAEEARAGRWLHGLMDFVTDNERMPDDNEIRDLQWQRDGIEQNLEAMRVVEAGDKEKRKPRVYNSLARLRRFMLRQAEMKVFGKLITPDLLGDDPSPRPLTLRELKQEEEAEKLRALTERLRDKPLPLLSPAALNRRGTVAAE